MESAKIDFAKLYDQTKEEIGFDAKDPIPYVVSSGSLLLDRALSVGGFPGGRIVEIYGPESSGKTTLGIATLAQAQRQNLPVGYIDMETAYDAEYAKALGLKGKPNADFAYAVPDTGEQALATIELWVDRGIRVILVDSVAAMVPKAELEGDFGESNMGLMARMMSQGLRKLTGIVYQSRAIVIFINQVRMKIGVMFGNPETTTGGNALKFYASIRLEIRANGEEIKLDDKLSGRYSSIKVKKSRVGPPLRVVQVPVVYGRGIWRPAELFDLLLVEGLIERKSSFYYAEGEKIGAGRLESMLAIEKDEKRFLKLLGGKK